MLTTVSSADGFVTTAVRQSSYPCGASTIELGQTPKHGIAPGKRMAVRSGRIRTASGTGGTVSSRIAPELSRLLAQARQGSAPGQTVGVIVQYRQVPTAAHYTTMQNRGGRLHVKLHMIKGAAFTIPVSTLPALEAYPGLACIYQSAKEIDEYTDPAIYVSAARNLGYDGTGIGVAVIDSGLNDNHRDLWDSTETHSRVSMCIRTSLGRPSTTPTVIWFTTCTDMARTCRGSLA